MADEKQKPQDPTKPVSVSDMSEENVELKELELNQKTSGVKGGRASAPGDTLMCPW